MPAITRRTITLTAMIFAVAMTFIDQTIVSVAAPQIQTDLGLSSSGLQWGINSYLLALTALFVLGGRLADTHGQRRMVTIGIVIFAAASALCGLTPTGPLAAGWLITFRAVQGAGGALMYPAALAIVVNAYRTEQRGRALAIFFGVAGGLTALGPALGGYLIGWTWRSIFWINIPIALIALLLTARAKPANDRRPARLDLRRPRADHLRRRAERVRAAAERALGMGQPAHRHHDRGGRGPAGRIRAGGVAHRVPADGRHDVP